MSEIYYHGTYRDRLDSIKKYGLGGAPAPKGYSQSKRKYVYLAETPDAARQWAAYADSRWDEASLKLPSLQREFEGKYLPTDDVVVLAIDGSKLDPNKLEGDKNLKIPEECPECGTPVEDRNDPGYTCNWCAYDFGEGVDKSWQYKGVIPPSAIKMHQDKTASLLFITIPLGQLQAPITKVAISVPELVSQTNSFSVKRRPGCEASLIKSAPKELYLQYNVKCKESYSDPAGHDVRVKFDVSKVQETQNANDLDVQLNCSCPAALYWGAQWNLHQRDALLGTPRPELVAPTQRLDLRGNFVLCVAPGTRVLMADGTEKLIEDVQIGDWVITHKGRPRRITHTATRPAREGEFARELVAKGAADSLIVSEDHPLATVRGNEVCFCGCKGELSPGYRGVKWGRKYLSGHHRNRPSRKLTVEALFEIETSTENQYTLAERYGVSQSTISRVQNKAIHVDDFEVEDCSQGKLHWVEAKNLTPYDYLYFPRIEWKGTTEVNLDMASLLGYYLAEGNPIYRKEIKNKKKSGRPTTKGVLCDINGVPSRVWGVNFTLNQDEAETLGKDIKAKLLRLLGDTADVQIKYRNYSGKSWLNVVVNDGNFAAEMVRLAGCGSLTKRLAPEVFEWSTGAIHCLVSSYALGDGHFDTSGQQYVYSISPHVISQISTILYSMGIWHGRLCQEWQGKQGVVKKKNRYYRLYWDYRRYPQLLDLMKPLLRSYVVARLNTNSPKQETDVWQEGFTRVLNSVTAAAAPENFHDLTVDEDESFIANGVVVHNCKHMKTVLERVLPSVQHNIINIVREMELHKNKEQLKQKETPDRLKKRQEDMKKRQEIKKIRKLKNKEIQQKLLDALRQREEEDTVQHIQHEEDKALVQEGKNPDVVGRDQPATTPTPTAPTPIVETPKKEDITKEVPEGEEDLTAMLEQEEQRLREEHHKEIKNQPHLHKGLPYETEEEKQEHGHAVPTDKELIDTLEEKEGDNGNWHRKMLDKMRDDKFKKWKKTRSSLEEKLLTTVVMGDKKNDIS